MKKSFIYSKMTIRFEDKNRWQYDTLKYIEFLEFICRISIFAHGNFDSGLFVKDSPSVEDLPIQYQVYEVLKLMFAYQVFQDAEEKKKRKK